MAVKIDEKKCMKCGGCVGVCPVGAMRLENVPVCDREKCTDCHICVFFCPVGAIEPEKGREVKIASTSKQKA